MLSLTYYTARCALGKEVNFVTFALAREYIRREMEYVHKQPSGQYNNAWEDNFTDKEVITLRASDSGSVPRVLGTIRTTTLVVQSIIPETL